MNSDGSEDSEPLSGLLWALCSERQAVHTEKIRNSLRDVFLLIILSCT